MLTLFRFFREERGATAIEYGLIAAGISIAIPVPMGAISATLCMRMPQWRHAGSRTANHLFSVSRNDSQLG